MIVRQYANYLPTKSTVCPRDANMQPLLCFSSPKFGTPMTHLGPSNDHMAHSNYGLGMKRRGNIFAVRMIPQIVMVLMVTLFTFPAASYSDFTEIVSPLKGKCT